MSSFNDNLGNFLTGCRESALAELKLNSEYEEWKSKQNDLRSQLETLIDTGAQEILTAYIEATTDIQRLEANKILLCGLTVSAELHKRFDTSKPEYKTFAEQYV